MRARWIFLLSIFIIGTVCPNGQTALTLKQYYAHQTVEDKDGVLAPWYTGQNGQLDERIRIAAELYKRYPWVGTDKAVMAAPHIVYNTHWSIDEQGNIKIPKTDPWMCGDLSQRAQSIIQGLTKHYAYTGDPLAFIYIPLTCDYILDYCLTDANHPWPKFPIATPTRGIGYKKADQNVPNQLDLCALTGTEFIRAYKLTGTVRYADAAMHWGDVIAEKCNLANPELPPWNRYTNPQFMGWSDKLTGTTGIIIDFLDELIAMGYTGKEQAVVKARDAGRKYLVEQMLPRWSINETWGRHYWDWEAAVFTGGMPWVCEYIMNHQNAFCNWKNDVRNSLGLVFNRNCVDPGSQGEVYSGTWAFPESSSCCGTSLSYNQYTYAPAFIMYGELTGDERMREIGRRMILMATYDSKENGVCLDGLTGTVVAGGDWLNLAQPWPLCQSFKAIALRPEIFGASRENHLLSSTSVVNHIVYEKGKITYSTFDAPSGTIDTLRLAFEPNSIHAGNAQLAKRTDMTANGYIVKHLGNGDCIVKVRHDDVIDIVIEGIDPQQVIEDSSTKYGGKWETMQEPTASGVKIHVTSVKGAQAKFTFGGNQVRLIGSAAPEGGRADVYLDGEKQLTLIDCYSPRRLNRQTLYSRSGLSEGNHELKIVAQGSGNLIAKGEKIFISSVQYSDATATTGYGRGGGPTATQRMICGYTGRKDYIDSNGNAWRPATEFVIRSGYGKDSVNESWYTDRRSMFIGNTPDEELYRYGIHGQDFWVNVTVGPGTYYVRLLFADTNIGATDTIFINGKLYATNTMKPNVGANDTIAINGKEVINTFEPQKAAGGKFRAMELVYNDIQPKNGIIEIRFKGDGNKEASAQAIEVGPWQSKEITSE